jgi:hypothetical protein
MVTGVNLQLMAKQSRGTTDMDNGFIYGVLGMD